MIIVYDDNTAYEDATPTTPLTFNHTVANQSNRLLIISIMYEHSDTPQNVSVNGVTYDGVVCSKVDASDYISTIQSATNYTSTVEMYYLLEPAIGTNQVSVTFDNAAADPNDDCVVYATSFYNVKQSAPEDTDTDSGALTLTASTSVTPGSASNLCFSAVSVGFETNSLAPGGDEIELDEAEYTDLKAAVAYEINGTSGGETQNWTCVGTAQRMVMIGAAWQEYVAPTPPSISQAPSGAFPDVYLSGSNYSIFCACSRWDVQDFSVITETWLKKTELQTLLNNTKPGAVGELYKIIDRPVYYDKSWEGLNTLTILPSGSNTSTLNYMREKTTIYPKNITLHPIQGDSGWIEVKIEGYISGN